MWVGGMCAAILGLSRLLFIAINVSHPRQMLNGGTYAGFSTASRLRGGHPPSRKLGGGGAVYVCAHSNFCPEVSQKRVF